MKLSLYTLLISLLCTVLVTCQGRVTTRDIKGLVDQQPPLLFGRRNLNPNMNSLFFGKRGDDFNPNKGSLFFGKRTPSLTSSPTPSEIKHACAMLVSYIDGVEGLLAEDGKK